MRHKSPWKECQAKNAGTGKCSLRYGYEKFCTKHWGQYHSGIINANGKKLRELRRGHFEQCLGKDAGTGPCTSRSGQNRFCGRHKQQYARGVIDINGKRLLYGTKVHGGRKICGYHIRENHTECVAKNAGTGSCTKYTRGSRFCCRHASQYHLGVIDVNGRKLRDLLHGPLVRYDACLAKEAGTGECTKRGNYSKFCVKHKQQFSKGIIDASGKKIRELKTTRSRSECPAKNAGTGPCTVHIGTRRFCERHSAQYQIGIIDHEGSKIRELKHPPRGNFKECLGKKAGTGPCTSRVGGGSRFCERHRSQYRRGILDIEGKKLRDLSVAPPERHNECLAKDAGTGSCSMRNGRTRFCNRHRVQFKKGIINYFGRKLKEPDKPMVYSECVAKHTGTGECSRRDKKSSRFCVRHRCQFHAGIIDFYGKKLRDRMHGYSTFGECQAKNSGTGNCSKRNGSSRFCGKHWAQYNSGIISLEGKRLRVKASEVICGIPGCGRPGGHVSGLCQKHYDDIITHRKVDRYPSLMNPPERVAMKREHQSWSGKTVIDVS